MWGEIVIEAREDYRGAWWVLSQRRDDGVSRVRACFSEAEVEQVRSEWGKDDAK